MLLVFFFTSSKLKKVGEEKKRSVDADFKGGRRNWIQVFSNSGIATLLIIFFWKLSGSQDKCLDSKESRLLTCLIGGVILLSLFVLQ